MGASKSIGHRRQGTSCSKFRISFSKIYSHLRGEKREGGRERGQKIGARNPAEGRAQAESAEALTCP